MSSKNVRVVLVYPPNQSWPDIMCKPNGSLAYPMLAGELRRNGVDVKIFDACVGNEKDDLNEVFYKSTELPSGLLRTGVSVDRILEEVADYDIIGFTSIFSAQESVLLRTVISIREIFPDKLIVAGGVNARNRREAFFNAGVDVICLGEAEQTILQLVDKVKHGRPDYSGVDGVAFIENGKMVSIPQKEIAWDLDKLPLPAWDLLPNERYWSIGRPHGGTFAPGTDLKYASLMTSLGCPFKCTYCHIAGELEGSDSGPIGKFRIKSDERVLEEMAILKELGVKQIFIEDDSLFGLKKRGIRLLKKIKGLGFEILDVNGVNIIHLLRKHKPDREVIEALVEAGFSEVALPFESGNARIIKKYASSKWNIEKTDIKGLIEVCREYGLNIEGNYMIGYPDETREEVIKTIETAKMHMDMGLTSACFMLVMPLPGTPIFQSALDDGYLPQDYDIDKMHWGKANMINTVVPPEELEYLRRHAWESINHSTHVDYKKGMIVSPKDRG